MSRSLNGFSCNNITSTSSVRRPSKAKLLNMEVALEQTIVRQNVHRNQWMKTEAFQHHL